MILYDLDSKTGVEWVVIDGRRYASLADARPVLICTPRQARLAMLRTPYDGAPSLLSAVEALIYASGSAELITSWEYAAEWSRLDPNIVLIGAALGLTPEQIDTLFALAMGITE